MRILLDMDGVLVDFVKGVWKLRGEPHNPEVSWDFIRAEEWAGMGEKFWAELEPTSFGAEIVAAAEAAVGPRNVCLLSSPCLTPGCTDGKMRWIAKHLPNYRRRTLFGAAKEFCASPTNILIDDHDLNTAKFEKAGGIGVLVPAFWNSARGRDPLSAIETLRTHTTQNHAR